MQSCTADDVKYVALTWSLYANMYMYSGWCKISCIYLKSIRVVTYSRWFKVSCGYIIANISASIQGILTMSSIFYVLLNRFMCYYIIKKLTCTLTTKTLSLHHSMEHLEPSQLVLEPENLSRWILEPLGNILQ